MLSLLSSSLAFCFRLLAQAVSTILNAFAKLEIEDEELFLHLGTVAKKLPAAAFQPQSLANILNACVKVSCLPTSRSSTTFSRRA